MDDLKKINIELRSINHKIASLNLKLYKLMGFIELYFNHSTENDQIEGKRRAVDEWLPFVEADSACKEN